MNKKIKKEWLEALRSGEYKQGRYTLCQANGRMCCLGVLIDSCLIGDWTQVDPRDDYQFDSCPAVLSKSSLEKCDMIDREQDKLIDMNDAGKSFDEIADWIEGNL